MAAGTKGGLAKASVEEHSPMKKGLKSGNDTGCVR